MYKIAFTTVTFRNMSRENICKIASQNNIQYIEWGGDIHAPFADKNAISEIINYQEKYSLQTLSYGSYYRLGEKNYSEWKEILNTAKALGARSIRIWMGSQSSVQTDNACFKNMVEETQKLADMALEEDIVVAFEFHNGTFNDSGDSTVKFLTAVNRKNVKSYWQPLGVKADRENLIKVLPFLVGIHVFNWDKFSCRYPLRLGRKKWKNFAEIVKNSKQDIPYIMEFVRKDSVKQFEKDINILKNILKESYGY